MSSFFDDCLRSCFGYAPKEAPSPPRKILKRKKFPSKEQVSSHSHIEMYEATEGLGLLSKYKRHNWIKDKESEIVIIGAGPAGIHMASILKRSGYLNVTILEESNRFGGKCHTIKDDTHSDMVHEMGSAYIHSNYNTTLEIIKRYENPSNIKNELIPLTDADCSGVNWVNDNIQTAAKKYIRLHKQILGEYERDEAITKFPPKPRDLKKINMTFLEFIKMHKLDALIPYFTLNHSLREGFGRLDKISALYGMTWNNPSSMIHLLSPKLQKSYFLLFCATL